MAQHPNSQNLQSAADRNLTGIVFESNGLSHKGIWDDDNLLRDTTTNSDMNRTIRVKHKHKHRRFKSPPVIPERNKTLMVSMKKGVERRNHQGFKSISPRDFRGQHNFNQFQPQLFRNARQKKNRKAEGKIKMTNKVSRLLETFQSVPMKIQARKEAAKASTAKDSEGKLCTNPSRPARVPNKVNINLK